MEEFNKNKDSKDLLDTAMWILQKDLESLRDKVIMESLEHLEAKTLTDYIKTLIAYQKDMRAGAKEIDVTSMSDEELEDELKKMKDAE